jgi:hypothetical protein
MAAYDLIRVQGSLKIQDRLKDVLLGPAELYEALRERAAAMQK